MVGKPSILPILAALLAVGCAAMPEGRRAVYAGYRQPRGPVVDDALARAATHVRGCYRAPRASFRGRQIVTRLRVRYTTEGQLARLPIVMYQSGVTPENETYAGPMAEAAIAAVMRCTPLTLPAQLYRNGFSEFDLTFSPLAGA